MQPQAMGQPQAEEESLGQFQGNRSIQTAVSGELFDFCEGCWLEATAKPGLNIFSLQGGDFKLRPHLQMPWLSCFICLMLRAVHYQNLVSDLGVHGNKDENKSWEVMRLPCQVYSQKKK